MAYDYGSSPSVTPRWAGGIGTSVDIRDGAVPLFSIKYDGGTGACEWWHNDTDLLLSVNVGAGYSVERVYVEDRNRDVQDWVFLDDVVIGTPEPATLAMLGIGALLLRRRRV